MAEIEIVAPGDPGVLYNKVWPILSAGRCLPIIDKVFPLLSAADAHRRMEAGDHIGKIVLKVAE
jgi:NADPH:quinone reductase